MPIGLEELGWTPELSAAFAVDRAQGLIPGRVFLEHKQAYKVFSEEGELHAEVTGKLRHQAEGRDAFPAVGDWVAMRSLGDGKRAAIQAVLPRFSKFSRNVAGNTTEEQVVAANVNYLFLVNAVNNDWNMRRLERYLILAWESGANPVIILSKADLCNDMDLKLTEVEAIAPGVPVLAISTLHDEGIDRVEGYLRKGITAALLGSSGSGKSTLINRLMGQSVQLVHEVRAGDDRGRHTTTHRELFLLPQGGMVIDTPGMRELQLWHAEEGLNEAFEDIIKLVHQCHFSDCRHRNEPKCAIRAALAAGYLDQSRLESYFKLERELRHLEKKELAKKNSSMKKSQFQRA